MGLFHPHKLHKMKIQTKSMIFGLRNREKRYWFHSNCHNMTVSWCLKLSLRVFFAVMFSSHIWLHVRFGVEADNRNLELEAHCASNQIKWLSENKNEIPCVCLSFSTKNCGPKCTWTDRLFRSPQALKTVKKNCMTLEIQRKQKHSGDMIYDNRFSDSLQNTVAPGKLHVSRGFSKYLITSSKYLGHSNVSHFWLIYAL